MEALTNIWNEIVAFFERYIIAPISSMGIMDVVDILLLAVLIYALYKFFRLRRAGRMLKGLVLIIILSLIVKFLKFPALSYLVQLFAATAFFCMIVIFQPEFRDALERIGNFSFLNPGKNGLPRKKLNVARSAVDEIVDAVFKLSDKRMGALIVFEGLTKLGDYIQSGKHVDAAISSHILRNIFFDKAPLHDGAIVIRDLRILACSCVLPPARSKMDFGNMGTRHRAAVGITEVSDALVVIVSEETGIVSVAQNRKLLRELDAETLKDILLTYIAGNTYLRSKKVAAREKYQDVIDKRWSSMMKESRSQGVDPMQAASTEGEEPSDEALPGGKTRVANQKDLSESAALHSAAEDDSKL